MTTPHTKSRIALVGGGPAALFLYKTLLDSGSTDFTVDIFEKEAKLGMGMPYSRHGAGTEHITNVSGNEIPKLVTGTSEWLATLPAAQLGIYNIRAEDFSDYKVFPRLLFGQYLHDQFILLIDKGKEKGIITNVYAGTAVSDIRDDRHNSKVTVTTDNGTHEFEFVMICSGHNWPCRKEGTIPGYFDSPYPPAKLQQQFNHPVAIKGAALTAIDAIRTIARNNGEFTHEGKHGVKYHPHKDLPHFRIVLHSIDGLLPGVRFHLEDTHLSPANLLTPEQILEHMIGNDGFLSLDYIFDKDFKEALKERDPEFYKSIRDLSIEEFVKMMMDRREKKEPFELLREEYREAEQSIRKKESVHWKEMISALSFAMNYPAKHFSAEDMLRLKKTLMPLISIVIAFVPQSSCEELLALHDAGVLEMVDVSRESEIKPQEKGGIIYRYGKDSSQYFETFVDGTGQPQLMIDDLPFQSLVSDSTVTQALLRFHNAEAGAAKAAQQPDDVIENGGNYFLKVPGVAITDTFRVAGSDGYHNPRIRLMAVPYIGGYNPDYSGLDFCEEASKHIVSDLGLA